MPAWHETTRRTESLFLHSSTVIELSCIWYFSELLFCELATGYLYPLGIRLLQKWHVQHLDLKQRIYKSRLIVLLGIKKCYVP